MQRNRILSTVSLGVSMAIFGSIGLFRRWIPLGSATLAAVRGFLGVLTVLCVMACSRRKPDFAAVRKNLVLLLLSGAGIGINWIFLFEAYNRTTVAVATLCYYMAPVIVLLAAPLVLREKLTIKNLLCAAVAVFGMVCISGVFGSAGEVHADGIVCGLLAAVFYAAVILINRRLSGIGAFDKTVIQLAAAAVVVLPYALLREQVTWEEFTLPAVLAVAAVGVIHTGIAYALYFAPMPHLRTETVVFFGYIDPVVAILLSVFVLKEPIGGAEIAGILCILGATLLGEWQSPARKKK